MIIRILGEGQYDVADDALDHLNELDSAVEQAIAAGDEEAFRTALRALLDHVRSVGTPHDLEAIDASDLILPDEDAHITEVAEMLADDGLIPG